MAEKKDKKPRRKVVLSYVEDRSKGAFSITVPTKWEAQPVAKLVEYWAKLWNDKNGATPLDAAALELVVEGKKFRARAEARKKAGDDRFRKRDWAGAIEALTDARKAAVLAEETSMLESVALNLRPEGRRVRPGRAEPRGGGADRARSRAVPAAAARGGRARAPVKKGFLAAPAKASRAPARPPRVRAVARGLIPLDVRDVEDLLAPLSGRLRRARAPPKPKPADEGTARYVIVDGKIVDASQAAALRAAADAGGGGFGRLRCGAVLSEDAELKLRELHGGMAVFGVQGAHNTAAKRDAHVRRAREDA
ncbi:peptide-aspartate beta-dioxygenase [Aureococcus anophagefferens]|uniref:Peptide-aspartate beta-dioxygenase n=1 Tax=Aureococcus anophagefferens TaxID=44056 RepID=A0ABR1G8Z8_AURAN